MTLSRGLMTLCVCLSFALMTGCTSHSLIDAPSNLRSFDKANPVGTDDQPYFGWYVQDPDPNEIQTAYQIRVASSLAQLKGDQVDLWDSGEVESDRQNYVTYAGKPLQAATRYYWQVRTWDRDGNVGPYSQPASFDVGLLTSEDWSPAQWIKRDTRERDNYTYFRKAFTLDGPAIERAIVYVTAVHDYELYLNGLLVGKGPAYHYPQYQYYNAFDVTDMLDRKGDNLFACLTHWYGGGQGRPTSERGLLLKAVIEYTDGSQSVVATDRSWKQTKVTAWDTDKPQRRNGEGVGYIDRIVASEIVSDWKSLDFNDSAWTAATEIGTPPVAPWINPLQPDLTRLIEREVTPQTITDLGQGTYVIDLGKIYAGVPSITFSGGEPNSLIPIQGGYTLTKDGTVSTRTTQNTNMSYSFMHNSTTATFQPMVYLGMRYIQVDNSPCPLTEDNVTFISRHYELDPDRSGFASSDPMLNRVWDLMKHSLILGCQEQFVDTPTREKGGFLGDSWSQGVPAMTTMGDRTMNLRVLLEFLDSQDQYWPDGRLNAVYPNVDGGRDIPDYTQSYLVWAWDYYMLTGNTAFLQDNYDRLKKVADYVDTYRDESTGLIHNLAGGGGAYLHGIIDWPPQSRYGYDVDTEARTVINAYAWADFALISQIAKVLGKSQDQAVYHYKAEQIKEAINSQLINDQGVYIDGLYPDGTPSEHVSQHANMFPLAMGLVPAEHRDTVIDAVKERQMSVGMVTLRWLPAALGFADQGPHLIELYSNPEWDGWAKTLHLGGTCTWETWDALTSGESMSHPWGAVGLLAMQQFILGVGPMAPQFAHIQIKPLDFGDALASAAGTLPTDRGDIYVDWGRSEDLYSLTCILPANVTAKVYVPSCGVAGTTVLLDGQEVETTEEGNYLYLDNIGSGTHTIERIIPPAD